MSAVATVNIYIIYLGVSRPLTVAFSSFCSNGRNLILLFILVFYFSIFYNLVFPFFGLQITFLIKTITSGAYFISIRPWNSKSVFFGFYIQEMPLGCWVRCQELVLCSFLFQILLFLSPKENYAKRRQRLNRYYYFTSYARRRLQTVKPVTNS